MTPDLIKRLETCRTLPTLPGVAIEVLRLCQEEDLDLNKIAKTISLDPALATKVLRMVNSPMYGTRQQVRTVSQAILLLGVNTVRTLALSFSLAPAQTKSGSFDLKRYWRRSIVSGLAAIELARVVGIRASEEAFMGALLQDIGMLAFSRLMNDDYGRLHNANSDDHERLAATEREHIGCDHAEAGGWLVGRWGLPQPFATLVSASHDPAQVDGQDAATSLLCKVVATSGFVADIWLAADPVAATTRAIERAQRHLSLSGAALEPLFNQVAQALKEVAPMFDVDPGTPDEINDILERAKETMLAATLEVSSDAVVAKAQASLLEAQTKQLAETARRLAEAAETDPLTGLYNRAGLDARIGPLFEEARNKSKDLAVILCDLDHFKKINDTHGHPAGDKVLVSMSALLKGYRQRDFAARWGGEEFVVVLPDTNGAGALAVAERLRNQLAARDIDIGDGKSLRVTMSLGIAVLGSSTPLRTPEELFKAADQALYRAKSQGRNRTEMYGQVPPAPQAEAKRA